MGPYHFKLGLLNIMGTNGISLLIKKAGNLLGINLKRNFTSALLKDIPQLNLVSRKVLAVFLVSHKTALN